MTIVNLLIDLNAPGSIDTLEFDAVISENHEINNQVTEFPVESGFNIADHAIRKPQELRLEAVISNSPIAQMLDEQDAQKQKELIDKYDPQLSGEIGQGETPSIEDRVGAAYATLCTLAGYPAPDQDDDDAPDSPKMVTVVTGLRVYNNMMITRLSAPRTINDGDSITFTIELKKIKIVNTLTAEVSNASELNGIAPNVTKQAAKKVDLAQVPTSFFLTKDTNAAIDQIKAGNYTDVQKHIFIDDYIKYGSQRVPGNAPGSFIIVPGQTP